MIHFGIFSISELVNIKVMNITCKYKVYLSLEGVYVACAELMLILVQNGTFQ